MPFKLCDHVYAKPTREVWLIIILVLVFILASSVVRVLSRCYAISRRGDLQDRTAPLVSFVGIDLRNNFRALLVRQWSNPLCLACYLFHSLKLDVGVGYPISTNSSSTWFYLRVRGGKHISSYHDDLSTERE